MKRWTAGAAVALRTLSTRFRAAVLWKLSPDSMRSRIGWTKGGGWNLNIVVFDEEQEADRLPRTNREAMGYTRFIMDELETWSDDELREIAAAEKEDMMFSVTFWFNDDPDADTPAKGYEFWASKLADHILRQRAEKGREGSNQAGYKHKEKRQMRKSKKNYTPKWS